MDVYDQAIVVIPMEHKFHQDELIQHSADQSKQSKTILDSYSKLIQRT